MTQLERQEVETRLYRTQKMEAIGMMAGVVAHDLNKYHGLIVSYQDMLLLDQPPGSPMHNPSPSSNRREKELRPLSMIF